MRYIDGAWQSGAGPFEHRGLRYPDGEAVTKSLAARLESEEF